ncbi:MAG: hypothetical protein DYH17_05245, partial [Xanthomonadales bacterium PRO6]|nr:hypothetical protein [Xanthomonadales bacterium PRO6]
RLRRWAWQRRWPLGAAAAVLLALVGGVTATWQQARRAQAEAERARSHLSALLDVIGAASPEDYLGHDPVASEFLVEAARRLRALPNADPLLQWQAQAQIGQGLINLGRPQAAVPVLEAALAAAAALPGEDAVGRELDGLRLLLLAQSDSVGDAELQALAGRITELALRADTPPGAALSALAAGASELGRRGRFTEGRSLLERAQTLLDRAEVNPNQRENYWRQRGWLALRARDLGTARDALGQALAVIDAHPADFSAMRRAEGGWLLAECALQAGDARRARDWLAQVAPQYQQAFPVPHGERLTLALMQARAELLAGDLEAARLHLDESRRFGAGLGLSPVDLRQWLAVDIELAARSGDCGGARDRAAQLAGLPAIAPLPSHAYIEAIALRHLDAACPEADVRPDHDPT